MEVVAIVISYARWVVASCVGVVAVLITRLLLGYPSFDLVPTSIFELWVIVNLPLHLLVTASGLPESVGGIIFYCLIFLLLPSSSVHITSSIRDLYLKSEPSDT